MINFITILISVLSIISIIILISLLNLNKYFESTESLMEEKIVNTPILNQNTYKFIKRIIDLCFGILGIIIIMPIFIIVYIVCKLETKESPIIKTMAIGENKNKFYVYKFRTLNKDLINIYPREKNTLLK